MLALKGVTNLEQQPRHIYLVNRGSAPRQLQSPPIRRHHPPVHCPSPPRRRSGAHQGSSVRRGRESHDRRDSRTGIPLTESGWPQILVLERVEIDLKTALGDSENLAANLLDYVTGFSENVKDIFDKYKISDRIAELDENNLLFLVTQKLASVDLSPATVPNEEMGHVF